MSDSDVTARLDKLERVLGLQKIAASDVTEYLERAAAGGMSTQSVGCHSGISLFCLERPQEQ
jgi:hypothetical protein